jgi:hypothetical protein
MDYLTDNQKDKEDEMKYCNELYIIILSGYCCEQKKKYGRYQLTGVKKCINIEFIFSSEEMYDIYYEELIPELIDIFNKFAQIKNKHFYVESDIEPYQFLKKQVSKFPCIVDRYPNGYGLNSEEKMVKSAKK